ncbi:response regulator [Roseateles sp. DC23W]|uniref:Response regulator n=1 Tax=Pelomonas dachongensis TaxID=3299029 RepID=A0ABW7EIH4_9BURK
MVVDDNIDAAEALAALLTVDGATVRTETNASNIVEAVRECDPWLVLLDLEMPGIDDFEACRLIRVERPDDIYVAALTGWSRDEDLARCKAVGFDEHLVKPIAAERLVQVIYFAAALRNSAADR